MLKTRRQMPAFLMLMIMVSLSVLAPYIAPYDPMHAITGQELQPPSARYLLGTDLIGRDVLSRVLYGGQQTLFVALVALIVAVLPGLGLGLLAATYSGPLDQAISAVLNALLTCP